MLSTIRASSSAAARRAAFTSTTTAIAGRRLFSNSAIRAAAANETSSAPIKKAGGSNWLTITGLTILAATSGYYLFSPVDVCAKINIRDRSSGTSARKGKRTGKTTLLFLYSSTSRTRIIYMEED
ncbi:hypothetical protein K457DRAFT_546349 [Linnemannia elongata AG-77]|uniref:Uncharacterized protein n=1 Tax=Linnemannia elongata AG-77 TaxID=1314771 RepID=A0A197JU75_9FUNG|nr:hypothetical protein K457DRAFT_546349 [Linnemannia elongata AG-77]